MKQEAFQIRWWRLFYSFLDHTMYLALAILQIVLIKLFSMRELWLALSLIFLLLAFLFAYFADGTKKILHAVHDTSGEPDRVRHRRQLLLAMLIYLSSALSVFMHFNRPALCSELLLREVKSEESHAVEILSSTQTSWGTTDLLVKVDGLVGVQLRLPYIIDLEYGDRFEALLSFTALEPAANPGGFDERAFRLSQGIMLKADLVDNDRPPEILSSRIIVKPQRLANRINGKISSFFASILGEEYGGLAAAMLLGNEQYLSRDIKEDFKLSGLSHLLVVSGSNVSLVFTFLIPLLQTSGMKWSVRQFALLPALIFFGALINWDASVSRAIAMNLVMITAKLLRRPIKSRTSLGLAICLILAIHPRSALQMGFLMSSAVSYALMTVLEPLADHILNRSLDHFKLRKRWIVLLQEKQDRIRLLIAAIITPLIAQLAVMPFTLAIGSDFTWMSIPLNWAAVPISAALMIMLTMISPLVLVEAFVLNTWVISIFKPIQILLLLLRKLSALAREWSVRSIRPGQSFIIIYLMIVLLLISFLRSQSVRSTLKYCCIYLSSMILLIFITYCTRPDLSLYFLSVGQGDAALILLKNGQSILIDTGIADQGEKVIVPAMRDLGVKQIDLVIITHMHEDHAGSLEFLMMEGYVKGVAVPPAVLGNSKAAVGEREWQQKLGLMAESRGVSWFGVSAGDEINLGRTYRMRCLAPDVRTAQSGNASSLVFLLSGHQLEILLTGDCEAAAEQAMLKKRLISDVDILKVAHHGSNSSSTDRFLAAARAEISLISVGPNFYGHPHPAVLQSLQDVGSMVFRTDQDGAFVVHSKRNAWIAYSYQRADKLWKGR